MTVPIQPITDPDVFRVKARSEGYSDAEIDNYLKQQRPEEQGMLSRLWTGIKTGVMDTERSMTKNSGFGPDGSAMRFDLKAKGGLKRVSKEDLEAEAATKLAARPTFADGDIAGKVGVFAGQLAVEAPLVWAGGMALRKGATELASKTASPLVQKLLTGSVPGSFWKSTAAAIPINMVESVAVDAILHPETVDSPEGIARSALLGGATSILGAKAGMRGNTSGKQFGPAIPDPIGQILAEAPEKLPVPFWKKLDQHVFDAAAPFKEMGDYKVPNSAYDLSRRLSGVGDQIHLVQNEKVFVPTRAGGYKEGLGPTSKELVQKIGTDPEKIGKFDRYLLGKSNYKLAVDDPDVQMQTKMLEAENPEFVEALEMYKKKTRDILETWHGYNYIDEDVMKELEAKGLYVPTGRSMSNPNVKTNNLKEKSNTASLREIKSPMQQLFEMERRLITMGENNKLGRKMLAEVRMDPDKWKGRIEEIVIDAPVEAEMRSLEAAYKASGQAVPSLKSLRAEAELSAFSNLDASTGNIPVHENGVVTGLRIADPMIREFFTSRAFTQSNPIKKAENFTTQAVFQPMRELTLKNAAMDQMEAFMNTKWSEYVPGYDFVRGMWLQTTNDPRLQRLRAERGLVTTRYADPNAKHAANEFTNFLKSAEEQSGVKTVPTDALGAIKELMGTLSSATRVGAGVRKYDATLKEGMQQAGGNAALQEQAKQTAGAAGARMARNVIADPQQMGTHGLIKMLSNSSFANYGLQSTRRLIEAANENPTAFGTKGLMAITIPSVALWAYNKGDEEINRIRKSKGGENFWYVRNPASQEIYSIAKPYLQGQLFGTSVEAFLDGKYDQDPRGVEQLVNGLLNNTVPNVMPVLANLAMEIQFGQNSFGFMDKPIPLAPASRQGALPEDVAGQNTFGISKSISEWSGAPAAQVDNFLKTILFSQGTDLVDRIDRKLYNRIAPETKFSIGSLIPATKKVNPNRGNVRDLNVFYEKYGEFQKVNKSIDLALANADPERTQKILNTYKKEYEQFQVYDAMNEVFGLYNQEIARTSENKALTPTERRDRVNMLRKSMIEKASLINGMFGYK